MGFLGHSDIAECKALPLTATVVAVNQAPPTLDVQIGEIVYEKVAVHYHCEDPWKEHSHPHSTLEREQMLSAFEEGDEVLVLGDDEGKPVCVTGFKESPKQCRGYFMFPTLTKIGATNMYDENGEPATPNQSAEGAFVGLVPGGGQGGTDHGFWRATFTVTGYQTAFTLYVNDIQMSGNYWDSNEHLELTGAPTTWRIVGQNWWLIKVTMQQQGYDEYEVKYPTVEFGYFVNNDADTSGAGQCAEDGGGMVSGHSTQTYFTGRVQFPARGEAAPWQTVMTSTFYALFDLYPYIKSQTQVDYDHVHHGYEEDEECHVASGGSQPYSPLITNVTYPWDLKLYLGWAPGGTGWGRGQTSLIMHEANRKIFVFGTGYRIVLTSDLLECWDCQQDTESTHYYVGDQEGDLLWAQPYARTLWQLKFQIEDSYLEELFSEYDLDLLSGDVTVDMTLPEELFGAM